MSLAVKILEKQAGTLTKTARAWLGGLITSESTGYTGTNCDIELKTDADHYWQMTGTSGTSMSLNYTTSAACVENDIIYLQAYMTADKEYNAPLEGLTIELAGTTGGSAVVMLDGQSADHESVLFDNYTLTSAFTGNLVIKFKLTDTSGVTGTVVKVALWTAINLTDQFGEEIDELALLDFFNWRCNENVDAPTAKQRNFGLYHANGDRWFFASKIADHGLEYNDMVACGNYYSNVYVLNNDWIITSYHIGNNTSGDVEGVTDCETYSYWTKTNYTSRVRAKTLKLNMREDIDASATLSFNADSVWQPQLGMTVMFMSNDEESWPETFLFTGRITQITTTRLTDNNWVSNCEVSSLLACLQWNVASEPNLWLNTLYKLYGPATPATLIGYLIDKFCISWDESDHGGYGLWYGIIDEGNSAMNAVDATYKTIYETVSSLCNAAGLILTMTGDKRLCVRSQTGEPPSAPRDITDAEHPAVWDLTYSENIQNYANLWVMRGGYAGSANWQVISYVTSESAISPDIFAGNPNKALILSDSSVVDETEADAAGALYLNRYGKVLPGEFSFTTTDLDYRAGQKITVDIASLGMTAAKTMNIDSVTIYDADGVNLLSNVVCSSRDSSDYAAAPNSGSTSYLADLSSKVSGSVASIKQDADTWTPELSGSTTAGTWEYSAQTGTYLKIGSVCMLTARIVPSSISDSPAGNLLLTGLPFAASVDGVLQVYLSGVDWGASKTMVHAEIATAESEATIYGSVDNGAKEALAVGNVSTSDEIVICGFYRIEG